MIDKTYSVLQKLKYSEVPFDYLELGPDFETVEQALQYIEDLWDEGDTLDTFKIRCRMTLDIGLAEEFINEQ